MSRPPGSGQLWGFRVALATALFLNLVALGLLFSRPAPLAPPGPPPTPGQTPQAESGTPTPAGMTIGPPPGTPTPPRVTIRPRPVTPTVEVHVLDPGGKMRGLNIPVWAPDFIVAGPSIHAAPAMGANWISLVSHWYVRTAVPITDGQIFREEGSAGTGNQRTASDESLGLAIDRAHALGLQVMLKPHVDWTEGGWRGAFYFKAADLAAHETWWTSYHEMISATVRLALDHGAEAICIGTEFTDINKEPASAAQWIHVIEHIRAAGYQGQLTYAANWGLGGDAEYNRPGLQGVWDQLDFIGVDAYYPLSDQRDPDVATLVAGWHTPLNQYDRGPYTELAALHARTGKPVVFTEVGYPAVDYAAKSPGNTETGVDNPGIQSRAAVALYQVWQDVPWWDGAFWWQAGPSYNVFSLQGRPIVDTLRQIWTAQARR